MDCRGNKGSKGRNIVRWGYYGLWDGSKKGVRGRGSWGVVVWRWFEGKRGELAN